MEDIEHLYEDIWYWENGILTYLQYFELSIFFTFSSS